MTSIIRLIPLFLVFIVGVIACKKDSAAKGEVWPKTGYILTLNDESDSVYVEAGNMALTSPYFSNIGINDPEHRWTISLATSGDGVLIHNEQNEYWSIDSAFHPGLNVEQHFISIRTVNDPNNLSDFNRFKFHKAGDDGAFYLESIKFRGAWVTGFGHAESGRGLLLKSQSAGSWRFWLASN